MQTIDTCRHLFLKYAFCINWQKCTASLYSCFVILNMLDTVIVVLWQNIDEDFLRYCCLYMTFLTGPTLFREINEFVSMYNSCYANIRTLFEHVYLWTKWCRDFFFFGVVLCLHLSVGFVDFVSQFWNTKSMKAYSLKCWVPQNGGFYTDVTLFCCRL